MLTSLSERITSRASSIVLSTGRSRRMSANFGQRYSSSATATANKLVEVTKNENGVSVVSMARNPVNGLNLELLTDLKNALVYATKDNSTGVVLTSSLSTIFSAGLDIAEMYKPDDVRVEKFWTMLQDTWLTLYVLTIPTAAAINGSSPAGGCLLAMSCDYRVMVEGKYSIGLNETRLGIVAPKWFMNTMIDTIGYRQAESALLRGTLFSPQEALRIGLVDDLAADKSEAIAKCCNFVDSFANIPGRARNATKLNLRGDRIAWLMNNRDKDTAAFLHYVKDPKVQMGLDLYMQSLKKKSKL